MVGNDAERYCRSGVESVVVISCSFGHDTKEALFSVRNLKCEM
jgi:hypothetical protein